MTSSYPTLRKPGHTNSGGGGTFGLGSRHTRGEPETLLSSIADGLRSAGNPALAGERRESRTPLPSIDRSP